MSTDILNIASNFKIAGEPTSWEAIGNGHIHKTYRIKTGRNDNPGYVLQLVNTSIFPDAAKINYNINNVIRHLKSPLQIIPAKDGRYYFLQDDGLFWRMFNFIPGSRTIEKTSKPAVAFEAGKAIAAFQKGLEAFSGKIHIILPGFHSLEKREHELMSALRLDANERMKKAEVVYRNFLRHSSYMKDYEQGLINSGIPVRITHNDTKLNNILFDKQGKAICLIDLDTVMPGYIAHDFGDALRTIANNASEDATNINDVSFNMELCNAFTKGYLTEARSFLTKEEQKMLPEAPAFMTYLIGIRFLADYLNGDVYYQISHQDHNLDRARTQMALLDQIFQKKGAIQQLF